VVTKTWELRRNACLTLFDALMADANTNLQEDDWFLNIKRRNQKEYKHHCFIESTTYYECTTAALDPVESSSENRQLISGQRPPRRAFLAAM